MHETGAPVSVPLTLKAYKGDQLIATKEYDRDIIKSGRLASAHLCLDDEKVSRIHSVIEVSSQGALSIVDMGSVEGTYVNGKRVNKGAVGSGDEIRLGNTVIRIEPRTIEAAKDLVKVASLQAAESVDEAASSEPNPAVASSLADAASAPIPTESIQ